MHFALAFLCCPSDAGFRLFFYNRFGAFYTQKNGFVFVLVKKGVKKRFGNTKKSKYR